MATGGFVACITGKGADFASRLSEMGFMEAESASAQFAL